MTTAYGAPNGSASNGPDARGTTFWLALAGHGAGVAPLPLGITTSSDEEALAVFSDEEEAGMFCALWGDGHRPQKSSAGEIISLLYGGRLSASLVALDPIPTAGGLTDLLTLERERFARSFGRRRQSCR